MWVGCDGGVENGVEWSVWMCMSETWCRWRQYGLLVYDTSIFLPVCTLLGLDNVPCSIGFNLKPLPVMALSRCFNLLTDTHMANFVYGYCV